MNNQNMKIFRKERNFIMVPNDILRNPKINDEGVRLYCIMLMIEESNRECSKSLAMEEGNLKEEQYESGLKSLIENGAITEEVSKNE